MHANISLFLAKRQGEGKAGQFSMAAFDAYFGESALTISTLPKF
jgi:hypothetical protein